MRKLKILAITLFTIAGISLLWTVLAYQNYFTTAERIGTWTCNGCIAQSEFLAKSSAYSLVLAIVLIFSGSLAMKISRKHERINPQGYL